jgi:hypothetical protein
MLEVSLLDTLLPFLSLFTSSLLFSSPPLSTLMSTSFTAFFMSLLSPASALDPLLYISFFFQMGAATIIAGAVVSLLAKEASPPPPHPHTVQRRISSRRAM